MTKAKEYRVTVRQFLTKQNPNYPDRKPVPMRVMFGVIEGETPKAYKVSLYGKPEPSSNCLHCGRAINHPVSVLYGIGPHCGCHYHIDPLRSEEEVKLAIESIKQNLANVTWTGWLPKGYIEIEETGNEVELPREEKLEEKAVKEDSLYPGLSLEQEELVEKARLNHISRPEKMKPTEIWINKKGVVKLVLTLGEKKGCFKILPEGGTPQRSGLPYAPKYSKIHDIVYGDVKPLKKKPAKPRVDEDLVNALADELTSALM